MYDRIFICSENGDRGKRKQIDEQISSRMREFSFDVSCQQTAIVVFSLVELKLLIFVHGHQVAHALTSAIWLHDVRRKVFLSYNYTPQCQCVRVYDSCETNWSVRCKGETSKKKNKSREIAVLCVCFKFLSAALLDSWNCVGNSLRQFKCSRGIDCVAFGTKLVCFM